MAKEQKALLEVKDLVKHFPIRQGIIFSRQVGAVQAVDGVSFSVNKGETLDSLVKVVVGRQRLGV